MDKRMSDAADALRIMAAKPKLKKIRDDTNYRVVDGLYDEIRAAMAAGYTMREVIGKLEESSGIRMSLGTMRRYVYLVGKARAERQGKEERELVKISGGRPLAECVVVAGRFGIPHGQIASCITSILEEDSRSGAMSGDFEQYDLVGCDGSRRISFRMTRRGFLRATQGCGDYGARKEFLDAFDAAEAKSLSPSRGEDK